MAPDTTTLLASTFQSSDESLLGGAGLAHADDELDVVASLWGPAIRTVRHRATVAEATEVLASHEELQGVGPHPPGRWQALDRLVMPAPC